MLCCAELCYVVLSGVSTTWYPQVRTCVRSKVGVLQLKIGSVSGVRILRKIRSLSCSVPSRTESQWWTELYLDVPEIILAVRGAYNTPGTVLEYPLPDEAGMNCHALDGDSPAPLGTVLRWVLK